MCAGWQDAHHHHGQSQESQYTAGQAVHGNPPLRSTDPFEGTIFGADAIKGRLNCQLEFPIWTSDSRVVRPPCPQHNEFSTRIFHQSRFQRDQRGSEDLVSNFKSEKPSLQRMVLKSMVQKPLVLDDAVHNSHVLKDSGVPHLLNIPVALTHFVSCVDAKSGAGMC